MTHNTLIAQPELTAMITVAGLMFGLLYFAALKRSVALLVDGNSWLGPLALMLGRIGTAVALLFVAAKLGAAPLLGGFAGFLIARARALRVEGRAS